MADEYEEFDYVPDDIENEYDYQIKKNPEIVKENKNKDIELSYGNSTNPKKTLTIEDEEKYNFEDLDKKYDSKKFLEEEEKYKKNEDDDEIIYDNLEEDEEIDKKQIKEKPLLREISYFENENVSRRKKINPIGEKYNIKNNQNSRVVSEIPKLDQTEFSQIGESKVNMNQSNEKFKNSNIQPDLYYNNNLNKSTKYI
jgi:hypothetical protein